MEKSAERISYITSYLSAYEEKIKLLNKRGLFDNAKMFELFAMIISKLYLKQEFVNLNDNSYNYPCVDLVNENKDIFVQVSTSKNIPQKIKNTLKTLAVSQNQELKNINKIKFFMLSNESEENVVDYSGSNQIGDIPFVAKDDLITTEDILIKAETDIDFQIDLYNILIKEVADYSECLDKFQDNLETSRNVGLDNIETKIDNKYEINRSNLVNEIIKSNRNNIIVHGLAGSGKSAICKKVAEENKIVIYARAERFTQENNINDIWGFNVKKTLKYLNNQPLLIIIDALEFIADNPCKLELLEVLYFLAKDYSNVKILASCRTSDKNAFLKIENKYDIAEFEVPEVSDKEQLKIASVFPVIKNMIGDSSYGQLLKNPFYINLIISNIKNLDDIDDENELRQKIWNDVICDNDNYIKKIIEKIVLERSKKFLVGVPVLDFDKIVIDNLISRNILLKIDNVVRLKYDIFEDICFEQYLDSMFEDCKGDYSKFFTDIEKLGRCSYRRYQIWVSNKLFTRRNREKFLFELIFSNNVSDEWQKQTRIGLIKSKYGREFFDDYEKKIIEKEQLKGFVELTNMYGYIISNYVDKEGLVQLFFLPIGSGREILVDLLYNNNLYLKYDSLTNEIEKLCSDVLLSKNADKATINNACFILQKYFELNIKNSKNKNNINLKILDSIYFMAEHNKVWIEEYWNKLIKDYQSDDIELQRISGLVIKHTLQYEHFKLAIYYPKQLCELAEMYWTYNHKPTKYDRMYHIGLDNDINKNYGLSKQAEEYHYDKDTRLPNRSAFFEILFKCNFEMGLEWAINFVNRAVSSYKNNNSEELFEYKINFVESNTHKIYLGEASMWMVTQDEMRMPTLIGDMLYCLKKVIIDIITEDISKVKDVIEFTEFIKKYIYKNSNNIALLTIVSDIGLIFPEELKGYALDLTTNMDIMNLDDLRAVRSMQNPKKEMLEKDIELSLSIPFDLSGRYNNSIKTENSLCKYLVYYQLFGDDELKNKCYTIIDYLRAHENKNNSNATLLKKIDARRGRVYNTDENIIIFDPFFNENEEKESAHKNKENSPLIVSINIFSTIMKNIEEDKATLGACIESIEELISIYKKNPFLAMNEQYIILLICHVLTTEKELDVHHRTTFCEFWIEGINEIISGSHFSYDYAVSIYLFKQLDENINLTTKNKIKKLILDILMYIGSNGIIHKISDTARHYLLQRCKLAKSFFNTMVKLSEDEMNHQLYNFNFLKQNKPEEAINFKPNQQPKLKGVERWIKSSNQAAFSSAKNEIIEKYLYSEEELSLSNINLNNHDISLLCIALNCGVTLEKIEINDIVKKIVVFILEFEPSQHKLNDIINYLEMSELQFFLQRELLSGNDRMKSVISILFENIEFSRFTKNDVDFYLYVFGCLLSAYFDAYSKRSEREKIENTINEIEIRLKLINNENVKIALYESLIFWGSKYGYSGNWSKLKTEYRYSDKIFLNEQFKKYGYYHFDSMLKVIYKLHSDKLLPEVLLSLSSVMLYLADKNEMINSMSETLKRNKNIVTNIISRAYLDFSEEIKNDSELILAFENILQVLIKAGYQEAAIILDYFRVY